MRNQTVKTRTYTKQISLIINMKDWRENLSGAQICCAYTE